MIARDDFRLAVAALAAPLQHFGAFVRCAALPFAICMAVPMFMTVVGRAFPGSAGQPAPDLPVFAQILAALLLGLALLSLISFSILWRRSLGLPLEQRSGNPLLTIDTRSLQYLLVRLGFSRSRGSKTAPKSPSWFRIVLGGLGLLLFGCVIVLGGMVSMVAGAIALAASHIPIEFFFSAVISCAFTYIWLGAADWEACSAVALGHFRERPCSKPVSILRLAVLAPLVALLFFGLSIGMPVLDSIGEAEALPSIALWIAALFLVVSWFGAIETLPFVQSVQTPGDASKQIASGTRRFRATPPSA